MLQHTFPDCQGSIVAGTKIAQLGWVADVQDYDTIAPAAISANVFFLSRLAVERRLKLASKLEVKTLTVYDVLVAATKSSDRREIQKAAGIVKSAYNGNFQKHPSLASSNKTLISYIKQYLPKYEKYAK